MRVLVTHPGRQHSHQTALALEGAGQLAGYWAGVPAVADHQRWVPGPLWRRFMRYGLLTLPEKRTRWTPWVPALRRLADPLPRRVGSWVDYFACRMFDRWAAARLLPGTADAVVACEISALATFRKAKRLGMLTFLDAAATHHATQDRFHGFAESQRLHRRITSVKDSEVALADHVLVVSDLARRSYLEAGIAPHRLHRIPLGVDTALFASGLKAGAAERKPGIQFVFAGAASWVKGFDVLLQAFARVVSGVPAARLVVIGPEGDASALLAASATTGVLTLGSISQPALAAQFRQADCLVLPSRNESFGMVVLEALATGLPVVVSDRVGAAELIDDGKNGWVVPAGDVEALAERLLRCAKSLDDLHRMRVACVASAAAADWSVYRERLPALLQDLASHEKSRGVAAQSANNVVAP